MRRDIRRETGRCPRDSRPVRTVRTVRAAFALALFVLALSSIAVGCKADGPTAAPETLPESLPDEALPAPPALPPAFARDLDAGGVVAPESPVRLAFAPEAGTTWRERLTLRQTVRHQGPGVPRGESEIGQELTIRSNVAATEAGAVRIEARIDDVAITSKPDLPGVVATARDALSGVAWAYREDARGTVDDVRPSGDLPAGARASFRALTDSLGRASLPLPEAPVGAGESWSRETQGTLALASGVDVPATFVTTATLRGVTDVDGRRHAVLDVDIRQRLRGPLSTADAEGEVVGAARGRGVVLFDLGRGRPTRSAFAVGARQELLVKTGGERRLLVQEHTLLLITSPAPDDAKP